MKLKPNVIIIALLLVFLTAIALSIRPKPSSVSAFCLDTIVTITVYGLHKGKAEQVLNEAIDYCKAYERIFSKSIESSDISRINSAGGRPVAVSQDTVDLLIAAIWACEVSGRAVDPTVLPLEDVWQLSKRLRDESFDAPKPAQKDILEALSHVNYRGIIIATQSSGTGQPFVRLSDPAAGLDTGFIAKGYIADKLKEFLMSKGVESAVIDLGGNIVVFGENDDGEAFDVGIKSPFFASNGGSVSSGTKALQLPMLKLTDTSVVSSGTYERYFTIDGERFNHIFDLRTGHSCDSGIASVTIICPSSTRADALSTACLILGAEAGMELVDSLDNTEALFVTDDGEVLLSQSFSKYTNIY